MNIIIIAVILITVGSCEGRKRHVIGKILRFTSIINFLHLFHEDFFPDTCVILGDNVTEESSSLMASFRLANTEVLDKLSPPLRLNINTTDIYREGEEGYYNNTSNRQVTSSQFFVFATKHLAFVLCANIILIFQSTGCASSSPGTDRAGLLSSRARTLVTATRDTATPPSPATPSSTTPVRTITFILNVFFTFLSLDSVPCHVTE